MNIAEITTSIEIGFIYGVAALGVYYMFRIMDFSDLTCDGSFATGAAVCAITLKAGLSPFLALLNGFLAGSVCGLVTGTLYAWCHITPLLSGILTSFMLYSINLKIMGGVPNIGLINTETIFNFHYSFLLLCIIVLFTWLTCNYILYTDFGLVLRSIGKNKILATMGGIRIPRYTIFALCLSNGLIGLSGSLFCQHQGFADISQGIGTIIVALAAVMIGEKLLPYRSISIATFSCILGSIIYRLIITIALHNDLIGLQSSDINIITGLTIICIMFMNTKTESQRRELC